MIWTLWSFLKDITIIQVIINSINKNWTFKTTKYISMLLHTFIDIKKMALSKFCPNLLLTLWNQNETMWVSRFFCRALDGCWLIKAILLLLPSYCRDIVNIVVEVMLMMVWIVIILESNFSNKFLLIRILWSQDYVLTVY